MIIPFPVLVVVMVTVFAPVSSVPRVMFSVATETLLNKVMVTVDEELFMVSILNVVAPLMVAFWVPKSSTVPDPAVKLPLLTQLLYTEWVKVPEIKVVPVPIVMSLFIVIEPAAVLLPPVEKLRLL